MQEEYIKEEQANLKRELLRAQEEVKRIQSVPLVIGQFLEMVDAYSGVVGSTTGAPQKIHHLGAIQTAKFTRLHVPGNGRHLRLASLAPPPVRPQKPRV